MIEWELKIEEWLSYAVIGLDVLLVLWWSWTRNHKPSELLQTLMDILKSADEFHEKSTGLSSYLINTSKNLMFHMMNDPKKNFDTSNSPIYVGDLLAENPCSYDLLSTKEQKILKKCLAKRLEKCKKESLALKREEAVKRMKNNA